MVTTLTFCVLLAAIDPNAGAASIGEANATSAQTKKEDAKNDEARMLWVWRSAAVVALGEFLYLLFKGRPVQAVASIFPVFVAAVVIAYILLML
jgi:hypothetical protein